MYSALNLLCYDQTENESGFLRRARLKKAVVFLPQSKTWGSCVFARSSPMFISYGKFSLKSNQFIGVEFADKSPLLGGIIELIGRIAYQFFFR